MRHGGYSPAKRVFDVVGASCLLLAMALPLGILSLLIKLSDPTAPVFFRQRRCGEAGHLIGVLKFRTMVKNADALKEALREQSDVAWPDFRLTNDPRVTRLGRFLRTTSLDELPQLFNVLRGDMALVGPRPTSFHSDTYELWQTERLEARPGITGPWQVWGRSSLDFEDRCRLEITYFRVAGARDHLRVLAATVLAVVRRTGVA
jgi:lipopolysaccharide/colanic/teichoic acid biosynthesis glycosyltransferase